VHKNNLDLIQILIDAGAEVNPDISSALKPLQIAINDGFPHIVNFLLSKGASCVDLLKSGVVLHKLPETLDPKSPFLKINKILSDLPMVEPFDVENEQRKLLTHFTEVYDKEGIVVLRSDLSV